MIFLIIPAIVIPCLMLGCAVFFLCAVLPPLRRHALSASLWCAALSPWLLAVLFGTIAFLVVLGLAHEASTYALMHLAPLEIPGWSPSAAKVSRYLLIAVALIGSLTTATITARLHQIVIHRITLALFRLYVAAVSFAVGILTSFFVLSYLSFSIRHAVYPVIAGCSLGLVASATLAVFCYKSAAQFRGEYPGRFPIVTQQEFTTAEAAN